MLTIRSYYTRTVFIAIFFTCFTAPASITTAYVINPNAIGNSPHAYKPTSSLANKLIYQSLPMDNIYKEFIVASKPLRLRKYAANGVKTKKTKKDSKIYYISIPPMPYRYIPGVGYDYQPMRINPILKEFEVPATTAQQLQQQQQQPQAAATATVTASITTTTPATNSKPRPTVADVDVAHAQTAAVTSKITTTQPHLQKMQEHEHYQQQHQYQQQQQQQQNKLQLQSQSQPQAQQQQLQLTQPFVNVSNKIDSATKTTTATLPTTPTIATATSAGTASSTTMATATTTTGESKMFRMQRGDYQFNGRPFRLQVARAHPKNRNRLTPQNLKSRLYFNKKFIY